MRARTASTLRPAAATAARAGRRTEDLQFPLTSRRAALEESPAGAIIQAFATAASSDMTAPPAPKRRDFRLTKIICTLGPASSSSEMIEKLAKAGMNIARLNMSHGDHEGHLLSIRRIRSLNRQLNHPVSMMLDLQGPEIRTGVTQGTMQLNVGEEFWVTVSPQENTEEKSIHVDYKDMVQQLKVGDRITVDNGLINLAVLEIKEHALRCRVVDGGKLGSRKHINLPGVRINLPSITDKDRRDILFGIEHDIDFIALSFVRNAEAVNQARQILEEAGGHHARLIAKIENQEGIDNFDEILEASDGIMVARGDLGVEIEFSDLPAAQRMIVQEVRARRQTRDRRHAPARVDDPEPDADARRGLGRGERGVRDRRRDHAQRRNRDRQYPVRCVEVLDKIARRTEKEQGMGFERDAQARRAFAKSSRVRRAGSPIHSTRPRSS